MNGLSLDWLLAVCMRETIAKNGEGRVESKLHGRSDTMKLSIAQQASLQVNRITELEVLVDDSFILLPKKGRHNASVILGIGGNGNKQGKCASESYETHASYNIIYSNICVLRQGKNENLHVDASQSAATYGRQEDFENIFLILSARGKSLIGYLSSRVR